MATSATYSKPTHSSWLPGCAPMQLIIGVILVALLQTLLALEWHFTQPFFRLPLQWQGDRIVVMEAVSTPVSRISASSADYTKNTTTTLTLPPETLAPDPDFFASYNALNTFYLYQEALYQLLASSDTLVLHGANRQIRYAKAEKRLSDIPAAFWIFQVFGALGLLIGSAFWAFHRHQATTRILVVASAGFALMEWTMALYSTRELAISAHAFSSLVALNHLGGTTFAACTVALLLYHPTRLSCSKILPIVWPLLMLCWLNEQMQWIEWPINIVYFPTLVLLLAFMVLTAMQWHASRQQPAQRRQLLWLVGTLLAGLGLAFALYIVPLFLFRTTWLSLTAANAMALLVFIGFVLGVQRSELFGIHRWWMRSWIVCGAALVLIALDISALFSFSTQAQWGLGLLTLALAWLYLPLRQHVWRRLVIGQDSALALPSGYQTLPPGYKKDEPVLQPLLEQFKPLHVTCSQHCPDTNGAQQGLVMILAIGDGKRFWIFIGKMRGFSLFTPDDARSADELLQATNSDIAVHHERQRIMRDLHDDVAADLLTLLHEADSDHQRTQVRDTLDNLRTIIYSLQPDQPRSLTDYCNAWEEDFRRRCRIVHCTTEWHQHESINAIIATPSQALQLQRILREAITNALRHARPSLMQVTISTDATHLNVHVVDNGSHRRLEEWRCGRGLENLQHRAQELQGQAQWQLSRNHRECHFNARIPLQQFTQSPVLIPTRKTAHAHHIAA